MSTDLAIAAIKAQALWDASEDLRRQAADLHPEFARMLAVDPVNEALVELRERCAGAVDKLELMIAERAELGQLSGRLEAKQTGVKLALSYVDEELRLRRHADAGPVEASAVESGAEVE